MCLILRFWSLVSILIYIYWELVEVLSFLLSSLILFINSFSFIWDLNGWGRLPRFPSLVISNSHLLHEDTILGVSSVPSSAYDQTRASGQGSPRSRTTRVSQLAATFVLDKSPFLIIPNYTHTKKKPHKKLGQIFFF